MTDLIQGTIFQTMVVLIGALATVSCAVLYFQRVSLERPPIGYFNARDIVVLFVFILVLPFLYLVLPSPVLIGLLVITFSSAMYMGLRPLLRPLYLWPLIFGLIAANILVTETLLGTRSGWQVYWALTDIVILLSVMGVSNLYVQGGMRLRHVAWFAFLLGFYDGFFAFVVPILARLADRVEGQPLDASIGFVMGPYNGNIGIGDLLVYSLFMVAAYKAFGKRGVISSFIIVTIFGALLPATAPLIITATIRSGIGIVVPAQIFFGPAALVTYFLLSRKAPERSMAEWFKAQAALGYEPVRRTRRRVAVSRSVPAAVEVRTEQAG